jgi:hypothetical protein
MTARDAAGSTYMPKAYVVNGALLEHDPNTKSVRVAYENFRNSPIYERIWSQIDKNSLDPSRRFTGGEQERLNWVFEQADNAFKRAISHDVRRLATPEGAGVETPARPVTDVSQTGTDEVIPTEIIDPQIGVGKPDGIAHPADAQAEAANIPLIEEELRKHKPGSEAHKVLSANLERAKLIASGRLPPRAEITWDKGRPVPMAPNKKAAGPEVVYPEQQATMSKVGQLDADAYQVDKDSLSSLNKMEGYLNQMNTILSNPNIHMVSGPLHEQLTTLGGFINYVDPDARLAKAASSVPAYFGTLMDVLRDKIQALGSGTAVSNLDLVVTQKSLGDLRNTPEGNRILNALLRLNLSEFKHRLDKKTSSFDRERGTGYSTWDKTGRKQLGSTPQFTLIRNPNNGEYSVVDRETWLSTMQAKFKDRKPEELAKHWNRIADENVRMMLTGAKQELVKSGKYSPNDPIKFQGKAL